MPFDLPPITRALLIANIAVYLLQQVFGDALMAQYFALWPLGLDLTDGMVRPGLFNIWQVVTYAFMHANLPHLLFNMLALFMFGGQIERLFGEKQFLLYYFVSLLTAALCQLAFMYFFENGQMFPTVGASGAIFGLLLAFGMMYPHEKIMLMLIPVPMPAWLFVTGYAALELFFGITGTQAGVAHFAHLGGMLGGYLLIEYWRGKFPIKPRRRLMR